MTSDQASAQIAVEPAWERWVMRAVLALFVAVEINNVHNLAFEGQDYSLHIYCTDNLINHPDQWFSFDFTNRPAPYWIGAFCHWLTLGRGGDVIWAMASLVFVILNVFALHLLHDFSRRIITSPVLRIAAVTLVAFLPTTLVTGVVYAADATAQLPFVLAALFLLRCVEAKSPWASATFAGLAGLALCLGDLSKFTFLVVPLAVVFIALALWRWGRIPGRNCLFMLGLAAVVPLFTGVMIQRAVTKAVAKAEPRHLFETSWKGTGEMTWSSVLLLKRADLDLLQAPGYWDPPDAMGGSHPLLIQNRYSYPGLFHLGVFTDVLDYANQGGLDDGVPRPEPQKKSSILAVRLGLLFSVPGFLAVVGFAGRAVLALFRPRLAPSTGVCVLGAMALTWYLPLVAILPYLRNSYEWGYWLPRLTIPALWGFGLVLFAAVDGLLAQRRYAVLLVALLVLIQTVLHIRSVWY